MATIENGFQLQGVGPEAYERYMVPIHGVALAHPVPDAHFDVAVCQQAIMFFPDRALAVREMHRALKPGGRVGLNVFRRRDSWTSKCSFVSVRCATLRSRTWCATRRSICRSQRFTLRECRRRSDARWKLSLRPTWTTTGWSSQSSSSWSLRDDRPKYVSATESLQYMRAVASGSVQFGQRTGRAGAFVTPVPPAALWRPAGHASRSRR